MDKCFKDAFNKNGIKGGIRYFFRRASGFQEIDEQFETINFIINHYLSIQEFPKATGALRDVQNGDTLLLAITDAICRKHGFEYWLDAGTCLGCERHNGFIPWDDDMDICMMRDTYEKALPILKEEFNRIGLLAEERKDEPISRIGISFEHYKTGLWIDLLPAEYTTIDANDNTAFFDYKRRCESYQRKWRSKRFKLDRKEMFDFRKKYIPEICSNNEAKSIIYCPEFGSKPRLWNIDDIFPLQYREFEGHSFPVPNHLHEYLVQFYGQNYNGFPMNGVAHHGNEEGLLTTWAEKNGIDMNEVNNNLKEKLEIIRGSAL